MTVRVWRISLRMRLGCCELVVVRPAQNSSPNPPPRHLLEGQYRALYTLLQSIHIPRRVSGRAITDPSVNGVATSSSGLQLILDEFHRIFGRRVTGIHNKTFGLWWDVVECMLQRDLLWPTEDVRVGYQVSYYESELEVSGLFQSVPRRRSTTQMRRRRALRIGRR